MCGLAGVIDFAPRGADAAVAAIRAMTATLVHRGPDGDGIWCDQSGHVAIGHRRLAIIDLSASGEQPMLSESGRYRIVYNGEIYGFGELRAELAARGRRFRGHSDTEVLLAGFETWGIEGTLPRVRGMFAFAVIDHADRRLVLARDRLGKKPLYLGLEGRTLTFASELKAIRAHPAFERAATDPEATALYLRYGYIPAPRTIYRGVAKLPAGTWLDLPLDTAPAGLAALLGNARAYWRLDDALGAAGAEPIRDEAEALERLDTLLGHATAERMISDVPVGAFLSGGIDSSLVTALMCETAAGPVSTYTIRFEEEAVNEADHAAAIARHLGTRHTELTATPAEALALVGEMPEVFDEPFGDPSQIPTLLVSRLVRSEVTVALSGDGGDESFAGYSRYAAMGRFHKAMRPVPGALFRAVERLPEAALAGTVAVAGRALPVRMRREISADRVKKFAHMAAAGSFRGRYDRSFAMWRDAEMRPGLAPGASGPFATRPLAPELSHLGQMMALDTAIYLPDDVLVKVDRASMAASLEVRSPLLDHRVVELAWRLPAPMKLHRGTGKRALRELLARRVPPHLFERPKQGFSAPVNEWLRGPLRDIAADAVSPDRLARIGVLEPAAARRKFEEHQAGTRNWGRHLWCLAMLALWQDRWAG